MIRDRQQNLQDLLVFALLIAIGVAGRWGQPVNRTFMEPVDPQKLMVPDGNDPTQTFVVRCERS